MVCIVNVRLNFHSYVVYIHPYVIVFLFLPIQLVSMHPAANRLPHQGQAVQTDPDTKANHVWEKVLLFLFKIHDREK